MEQGVGEGGEMNKHPHDARVKEIQQGGDAQVQVPQQAQKCPRCDSPNTKFCYYNNYSLSQPRYFCKTCRRYWTQGGTLRNVPVGGGCRKGKRAKSSNNSSSSEINSSSRSLPQGVVVQITQPAAGPPLTSAKEPSSVVANSPFYHSGGGGGYLSSLAAMHSLNPFVAAGSDASFRSSNLGLLSGFNVQRPIRPPQLYQMGSGEREMVSLYEQAGSGLVNPSSTMANTNSSGTVSHHDRWPQSFINNRASDASMWSTISTTVGSNSERTSTAAVASSSLLTNNQWPNLPGYGPPP